MNMLRIALVSLNDGNIPVNSYSTVEHLGLAYLAAALRKSGYSVKIIDAYALNLPIDQVIRETFAFSPQLIGVNAEYNTFPLVSKYCSRVKKIDDSISLCTGGEHATFAAEEILRQNLSIDFVVRGEGEITIVEAADRLSAGKDLKNIKGVYSRDKRGGIVKYRDREAIKDLDFLTFPSRDILDNCVEKGMKPAISILTSRGCHNNCEFCNASRFFNLGGGKAWRARSPANVIDELKYLYSKYDTDKIYPVIYFQDENFIGPGKYGIQRARDIANEIIESKLDISFEIFCRTDSFIGEEETLKLLKQAGLTSVLLGIESGSQNGLDVISKKTTVDQNLSALQLFRKHNIVTSSSGFIMFNPYSELSDLEANADFLLKIGQATIYNMSLKVLLYPGIRIIDEMSNNGLIKPDFCHYRVDGYRFVNSKVSKVAEAVNSIDIEIIKEEDAALRHLDLTITKIEDILNKGGNRELSNRLTKMKKAVMDAKTQLNKTTHKFFMDIIHIVKEESYQSKFFNLKNSFLQNHRMKFNNLNSVFQEFLEEIENAL